VGWREEGDGTNMRGTYVNMHAISAYGRGSGPV
jgi:hypothetical protein